MRKLIMWNIISLDGCFEGNHNWDLPFHNLVWGEELEKLSIEQLHSADYLVFGRVTYEGMAAHWTKADGKIADLMNKIPKLVFSKTLKSTEWNNSTLIKDNAAAEISKIKAQGDGDMYVFGSAILSETFINDNLFDEYRIGIAPIILGSGRPLFKQGISSRNLSLTATQQLLNGGVVLRFSSPQIFYHGTKADLKTGDLVEPGFNSNYGKKKKAKYIYLTATLDAAIWGAELSSGEGHGRIYTVEPTGEIENDPNLTDKKFPGNPTKSYRSFAPLRVTGEITNWQGHSPAELNAMKQHLELLKQKGIEAIED